MTNNTLKTLRNSLIATALVASTVASTNVAAEEVNSKTTENKEKVETTTVAPSTSKDLKPVVDAAKANVETAQKSYDEAVTNETTQKSIVNTATNNSNVANNAVTTAIENFKATDEIVKTTTPEVIANQEKEIENNKSEISDKESDLNKANDKVATATAEEAKQKEVVTVATNNVKNANQEVANVQNEVDAAKANLEDTNQGKLVTEVNNIRTAIAQNQQDVSSASATLEASKQDEANSKANIEKQIASLEAALNNAGTPEIVETKKTVVGNALFNYNYTDGTFAKPGQVLHEQVIYADGTLKEEIIKENNKTAWDTNKLSQYIAEYITQIRKLNGINKPVRVTSAAMNFANDRAKEMDNGSIGHTSNLNPTSYGYEGRDEGLVDLPLKDIYGREVIPEKEVAYNIVHSLFDEYDNLAGDNYGHRESLLLSGTDIGVGVSYKGITASVIVDYLGDKNDLEVYKRNGGYTNTSVFSITNNDSDPTKSEHWYNGKRLVFLPKAQMDYITTENITKPNPAYNNAKKALEDYKTSSATVLANKAKIVADNQAKLNSAQTQLANSQTALKQAEGQLGALNASVQDKAKTLADAEEKLNTAKATLKIAEDKLKQEQAKLDQAKATTEQAKSEVEVAKKALENAKAKLTSEQATLEKLKNAKANLTKAKEELTKAETAQKHAKSVLDAEQAKLEELAKATAVAKAKLDEAQHQFDKVNKEYTTLLQLENAQKTTTPVNTRVTPSVAPLATTTQNVANAITVTNKVATNKKLPNTGSETSPLALVGVALIGLLGLAKVRKTSK